MEYEKIIDELKQEIRVLQDELQDSNEGLLALTSELQQAEEKYRSIIERSSEGIIQADHNDVIIYFNPAAAKIFGFDTSEQKDGQVLKFSELFNDSERFAYSIETIMNGQSVNSIMLSLNSTNEKKQWLDCTLQPIIDENLKITGIDCVLRDITQQKESYEKVQLASKVFKYSLEGIIITDSDRNIIMANPAFTLITGYLEDEVFMKNPNMLSSGWHDDEFYKNLWNSIDEHGYWTGEIKDRRKNGEVYEQETTICAIKNDSCVVTNYCAILSDITERNKMAEQVNNLAYYDFLTQLPNRFFFKEKLEHALNNAERTTLRVALFFLDMDNFKVINDTLGHYFGDKLLQEVSSRLLDCVRKNDTVARLGGDEFTVILEDLHHREDAIVIAENISIRLNEPYIIDGRTLYSSPSIGIAYYPQDAKNYTDLVKCADNAMYLAKAEGKNKICFFKPELNTKIQDYLVLETNLRHALEDKEFYLCFQPVINLKTGKIASAEALLRWKSASLGFVSPEIFIPHAETSGHIIELGKWVIEEACRNFQEIRSAGYTELTISINASAKQLREKTFVDEIKSNLKQFDIPTEKFAIEVTETSLIEYIDDVMPKLKALKELGITVLIDDFGTGYSSMAYLKKLPSKKVKIDRAFIKDIPQDKDDMEIATAVIAMSHALNKKVVAEGVETKEQLSVLIDHNCDEVQGFLFYRPMTLDSFIQNIEEEKAQLRVNEILSTK